ncbi:hypothetical protein BLNAU_3817 [Blattamonas nauphoetae]|uniref:Uncharacterized protein n=1 Tax=Blattamonas nauphoetae TaxID=2049346 RepID=A0ABQ9YBE6_9EUKA|nr:hypothetical protein BLNAU_3817 [Blattamonas nauphoetae]
METNDFIIRSKSIPEQHWLVLRHLDKSDQVITDLSLSMPPEGNHAVIEKMDSMSSQAHPSEVPHRNLCQVQGKLVRDSEYSFTIGLTREMKAGGLAVPPSRTTTKDPSADIERLSRTTITTNKAMDRPPVPFMTRCALVKDCAPAKHRAFKVKLFKDPYEITDNDNDYPIRMFLFPLPSGQTKSILNGKSGLLVM